MKKVLVTGKNSYIGKEFQKWALENYSSKFEVKMVGTKNDEWTKEHFDSYCTVLHVAGIAHVKETPQNRNEYYKINRDLAVNIAKKAKKSGIKHFVFVSSMSVYGMDEGLINWETPLKPNSAYGKSKLEAEELIKALESNSFKVSIVRPPMIYGYECKGNYKKLSKIINLICFFPEIDNKRSMIYIDNLSDFFVRIILNSSNGIFLPQNQDYVSTAKLVKEMAESKGKNIIFISLFNPLILRMKIPLLRKMFGNLVYDLECSGDIDKYQTCNFEESIKRSERGFK